MNKKGNPCRGYARFFAPVDAENALCYNSKILNIAFCRIRAGIAESSRFFAYKAASPAEIWSVGPSAVMNQAIFANTIGREPAVRTFRRRA